MKFLTVQDEGHVDLGQYGPACEGFVDAMKSLFSKKNKQEERAQALSKDRYRAPTILMKELDKDLKVTYLNQAWVEKNLPEQSDSIKVPGLEFANVGGETLSSPPDILDIAKKMFDVVKAVSQAEQPYIQLRKRLIDKAVKIKSNEELDQLWLDNQEQLKYTAVDRAKQRYKNSMPALGYDKTNPFPVSKEDYWTWAGTRTAGTFTTPTKATAAKYAEALDGLMDIFRECEDIFQRDYIPYWDILDDAIEYDDLKYGEEIFSHLFSSQDEHNSFDLARNVADEIGVFVCSLYIAYFDKRLYTAPAAKPANESFSFRDILTHVFGSRTKKHDQSENKTAVAAPRFNSEAAFKKIAEFVQDPESFSLTGKDFTVADQLSLAINGHAPTAQQLGPALDSTFKEALKLANDLLKSSLDMKKVCQPLQEKFEKEMVAVMDDDGNVPKEALDAAMKPIVAAAQKVKSINMWGKIGESNSKYNNFVGGNPVELSVKKFNGMEYYSYDGEQPPKVAMKKPSDKAQLVAIAKVLLQYAEYNYGMDMKGSLGSDAWDDAWLDYEFDRPVRHLFDEMDDAQQYAILQIYPFESSSVSLLSSLSGRMERVASSALKYVAESITSL